MIIDNTDKLQPLDIRLVTLCGSPESKFDAVRDSQDILEAKYRGVGLTVDPVDLGGWSARMVPAILRTISSRRPDVILMQYPTRAFGASLGPAAISAVQRIAPLVVMLHEFVAAHPLRKLAVGALLARADLIGMTADREIQLLCRWYPWLRHRLRHIPIASNIPPRTWLPVVPPTVVYFGQVRPEKGLEEFFECHGQVTRDLPNVHFQIVGATVPKWADYGRMIEQRARACGITVMSALDDSQVADTLAAATIALLPFPDGASFRRGSLFAAAACGVPLVTTVGCDTPAQLLSLIEPVHDVAGLAALTIRYLTDQPALVAAHDRTMRLGEQFGWDKTVDRYLDVFREAAGMRANPRSRFRPSAPMPPLADYTLRDGLG